MGTGPTDASAWSGSSPPPSTARQPYLISPIRSHIRPGRLGGRAADLGLVADADCVVTQDPAAINQDAGHVAGAEAEHEMADQIRRRQRRCAGDSR